MATYCVIAIQYNLNIAWLYQFCRIDPDNEDNINLESSLVDHCEILLYLFLFWKLPGIGDAGSIQQICHRGKHWFELFEYFHQYVTQKYTPATGTKIQIEIRKDFELKVPGTPLLFYGWMEYKAGKVEGGAGAKERSFTRGPEWLRRTRTIRWGPRTCSGLKVPLLRFQEDPLTPTEFARGSLWPIWMVWFFENFVLN